MAGPEASVVVAVPPLFDGVGSVVAEEIVAVFVIVAPAPALIATIKVKTALPGGNEAIVHVTVPPEPTAGVVQLQPAGEVTETKLVPAGNTSVRVNVEAVLGPALLTVMV
jgi:hypothetical protein